MATWFVGGIERSLSSNEREERGQSGEVSVVKRIERGAES